MKKSQVRTATAAAALSFIVAVAQAQTPAPAPAAPEPPAPLTANISVTTKYKFRGQDQGNTRWFSPAVQGGFDWTMGGFYLGNWNSNVNFSNAAIEMDFYGGYRGEFVKGFGYDVGLLQYYYPQQNKVINFDTTELYGALSWEWLTLKYSHTISKDYFGIGEIQFDVLGANARPKGRNTGYIELNANYPVVDKLTLNAHIGYTKLSSGLRSVAATTTTGGGTGTPTTTTVDVGYPSFYDYKLGVTYDASSIFGSGVSVAAAYVGANKKNFYGDFNKPRLILTVSKSL